MRARTFSVEANRRWGLIAGVSVGVEAVVTGRAAVDDEGTLVEGPAALVVVERSDGPSVRRWLRVGERIELAGEPYELRRVWDRGRRSTWANPLSHAPLPASQPGRGATFGAVGGR